MYGRLEKVTQFVHTANHLFGAEVAHALDFCVHRSTVGDLWRQKQGKLSRTRSMNLRLHQDTMPWLGDELQ